jgi:ATP-dependent Clp protease ATP-binding subunit ClpA
MSSWQPFAEHLRQSIIRAQEEVVRIGGGSVGTEHILLGIVGEGASGSAQLLLEWGVGLEAGREAAATLGKHPASPVRTGELSFTANAKQLIEQCFDVAREAGHDFVGTEHMLAAMTRQRAGGARTVIESVVGEKRFPAFAQAASDAVASDRWTFPVSRCRKPETRKWRFTRNACASRAGRSAPERPFKRYGRRRKCFSKTRWPTSRPLKGKQRRAWVSPMDVSWTGRILV